MFENLLCLTRSGDRLTFPKDDSRKTKAHFCLARNCSARLGLGPFLFSRGEKSRLVVIRSHIAGAGIGTFEVPLIDQQPFATAIGTAARVAGVHRRTWRK